MLLVIMLVNILSEFLNRQSMNDIRNIEKRNIVAKQSVYNRKTKKGLIDNIVNTKSCIIIQRRFRNYISKNSECPICLDKVSNPHCYTRTKIGHFLYYDLECFTNYLITSGDYRDPITKQEITDEDILKLEKLIKVNKIKLPRSLRRTKQNKLFFRKQKEKEEQIEILCERIRHVIWTIYDKLDNVFNCIDDICEFNIQLEGVFYPEISHYLYILSRKDDNEAVKISHVTSKQLINNIKEHDNIIRQLKYKINSWLDKEFCKYYNPYN